MLVANQPMVLAGVLDLRRFTKRRRESVRFCDAFNIPIVTFVDVARFLAGPAQQCGGLIKLWRQTAVQPIRNARCRW